MGIPSIGLLPVQSQTITWTNVDFWFIGPLEKNFSEILIEILTFSFKKMCLKMPAAKWRPFCSGGDELTYPFVDMFKFVVWNMHFINLPLMFISHVNDEW